MTETQREQYEVLEWVWNVAKKYEDEEDGIQQFRDHICKLLKVIAEEGAISFKQLLFELKEGLY